jgi:hypothetical protein
MTEKQVLGVLVVLFLIAAERYVRKRIFEASGKRGS